jgi:hypothetical protein
MPTLEQKYADLVSAAKASGASNLAVRTQDNVLYIDGVVPSGERRTRCGASTTRSIPTFTAATWC